MNELLIDILGTSGFNLMGWVFFGLFAAFMLGLACEPLHVPKRARPYVAAALVPVACWALDSPWQLLPVIALLSMFSAWVACRAMLEHSIQIGNRVRVVDYSRVNGGLVERVRGEVAAMREAVADEPPADTAELKRTTPQRGVIGVSARW